MNIDRLNNKIADNGMNRKGMLKRINEIDKTYTKQMLYNRLLGRTKISTDDIELFCYALNISNAKEKEYIFLSQSSQNCNDKYVKNT